MSMTGYQTRDLSDIKAFISYIASSPDCPATTTLRSWAEYEDLSDHAGFLTDLLDEARGRLDGFGLSGPECGAGVDADAMGVQGPARWRSDVLAVSAPDGVDSTLAADFAVLAGLSVIGGVCW